ncbi:MAG: prolipoprotein diacylglyceryl transferase [Nitrospirae bacterium]|nr:prolipoprotein diacylglyceryl transferase [Nitrospirota bacterium]
MVPYPNINPVIVTIGPFAIRWYGMMYLAGFTASYHLVKYQMKKKRLKFGTDFVASLYTYLIVGLLIGARLGYVLFYDLANYLRHPIEIFAVWHGGMSFHGGLIGSILGGVFFCKQARVDAWQIADLVIVTAPIGLGLGRIGNFINGELFGRVTDVPWAMVFPQGGPLPRHPSELYEFLLEGVVLFTVLWVLKDRKWRSGILSSLFLILYGLFRFFVEFFRQPDAQLGFVLGPFTMGQVLSAFMVLAGGLLLSLRRKA